MTKPYQHRLALLICAYFVLVALSYAAVTPPFEAPDEGSHFLYIHNLLKMGKLPVLEDRETVFASQSVQRHHPPLYYLMGAALIAWTQREDVDNYLQRNPFAAIGYVSDNNYNVYLHPPSSGDTAIAVWVLRGFSITLGTATVWFVYRTGLYATGDKAISALAALLVASIPSFIHRSASINNDNLVTFLHAAAIALCLRIWQHKTITPSDMLLLSLALGCVALTKINGITLFGIVYATLLIGWLTRRFSWRQITTTIGISVVLTATIAGWWYVRNLQLYGDPLALAATLRIWGRGGLPRLITLFEAKGVWESLWYTLGHFNIRGSDWVYNFYIPFITVMGLIGAAITFVRKPVLRLTLVFSS